MNNEKMLINLKNKDVYDGRFVFAKNINGESVNIEGGAYLIDLNYSNIKKFLSTDSVKLIKRVSDDELIIVTEDKDNNLFSHIKMKENGMYELYSKKYKNVDKTIKNILVGNTNTFILNDKKNKSVAYNSDLKASIEADRIEKKTLSYNDKEYEVLDCTDYLNKGNIFDTVEFYINPENFEVKGFYSKMINRVGFYFGKENSDINGFDLSIDGDGKVKEESIKFIKMYDDERLEGDKVYKDIIDEGEKLEYRFRKTYDEEILKYINILHQLEKIDSDTSEREAEKILVKKYFE